MKMTKSQEIRREMVKKYCPTAEVTETDYGVVWVNWNSNVCYTTDTQRFMASIGPRGGFKIVCADWSVFGTDKKHQRLLAQNQLHDMRLRGTVAIR